ncbi:MAG: hypothetical protein AAF747_05065, partial [Planctomycetota bacterium]
TTIVGDTIQLDTDAGRTARLGAATASPANWQAERIDEDGNAEPLDVIPTGLGRFSTAADLAPTGRTTVRLLNATTNELRIVHHEQPYPEEYNLAATGSDALAALTPFDPTAIADDLQPREVRRRLSGWLIIAACVAFITGVLLRRL